MIPASLTAAPAAPAATAAAPDFGARAPQRQRLPLVISGGQDDAAWLWRCVEQADRGGYHADDARYLGRSARRAHADTYRVASRHLLGVVYRVTYTPHHTSAQATRAHDGLWRCSCDAGAVGAACAHIGAAYLAACLSDAARAQRQAALSAQMAQLQEQARREAEAMTFHQNRYRALAAQMAALSVEAAHALTAPSVPAPATPVPMRKVVNL